MILSFPPGISFSKFYLRSASLKELISICLCLLSTLNSFAMNQKFTSLTFLKACTKPYLDDVSISFLKSSFSMNHFGMDFCSKKHFCFVVNNKNIYFITIHVFRINRIFLLKMDLSSLNIENRLCYIRIKNSIPKKQDL